MDERGTYIKDLSKTVESLRNDLDEKCSDLDHTEKELEKYNKLNGALISELHVLKENLRITENDLGKASQGLQEKSEEMDRANEYISQLNQELNRLKEFLRQRDSELERVISGNSEMKSELDKFVSNLTKSKTQNDSQRRLINDMEFESKAKDSEISRMKKVVSERNAEINK